MQETALEALTGKESCVAKGYYADHFLRCLRPPGVPLPPPMSPLIRRGACVESGWVWVCWCDDSSMLKNPAGGIAALSIHPSIFPTWTGYFTRVSALERIVAAFLGRVAEAALPRANLLLLGAGLDTLPFRLLAAASDAANTLTTPTPPTPTPAAVAAASAAEAGVALSCFDVDLAPVARFKASCLRASPELLAVVGGEAVAAAGVEEQQQQEGVGGLGPAAAATVVFRGQGSSYALLAGDLGDTAGLEGESVSSTNHGLWKRPVD